ncbi:nucleotidyltransferase domain-containing protein [Streptomyces sp. NRRL B-24484]|uniref:nucleotidyltransferase domain-containing protein n=1 Tax=Streptomyces sp. NRRL B-24484 TaxID=1463833 RepID=UPI000B109892|nr:nucleotidyltransferase domain-containing protein [Streptomyces sp. NRRL B-24484]
MTRDRSSSDGSGGAVGPGASGGETGFDRGLAEDGTIAREGSLDRVQAAFRPLVDATRTRIAARFGPDRLHSAYLYGSIPRGTAAPGVSDLDLLLALHREPTGADRAYAEALGAGLDRDFPVVDGAGVLVFGADTLLSPLERYDLGFFLACLCTPLIGDDLAAQLPRYRPGPLLARETNGDLVLALPRWRERLAAGPAAEERRRLARGISRRLVRTGFTLVMPEWNGWTSDLDRSAEVFATRYPARADQMRLAAATARTPAADPAVLALLVADLAPWLADEYLAVHGPKAPRP